MWSVSPPSPPYMPFPHSSNGNTGSLTALGHVCPGLSVGHGSYSAFTQRRSCGDWRRGLREALGASVTEVVNQVWQLLNSTYDLLP